MGTNYYFSADSEEIDNMLEVLKKSTTITKEGFDIVYKDFKKIHICKFSNGWKPLFQKTRYYETFEELQKFYYENRFILEIYNEYNELYNWESFVKKVSEKQNIGLSYAIKSAYDYIDNKGYFWSGVEFD